MLQLSVLDPSPLFEGKDSVSALADTRRLADAAEDFDYRSFWVQEHHNAPGFVGTAPEILIADLAARTSMLKIGAGGIMLPNYSPLKVAEQFSTLACLHPGRIELGLGRATGADPRASAALMGPGPKNFPAMARYLVDWLLDSTGEKPMPSDHLSSDVSCYPRGHRPDVWMLVSSEASAAFAGASGMKVAYADFLGAAPAMTVLRAYREAFQPSPLAPAPYAAIGVMALAADTGDKAEELARTALAWNLKRHAGRFESFPSSATANALLAEANSDQIRNARAGVFAGAADDVADKLRGYAASSHADELFVLTVCEDIDDRIHSYELLADRLL